MTGKPGSVPMLIMPFRFYCCPDNPGLKYILEDQYRDAYGKDDEGEKHVIGNKRFYRFHNTR